MPGTPCAVASKGYCYFPEGICGLFPDDKALTDIDAESYVGVAMNDSEGNLVGILCAISRSKINLPEKAREVLEIVAERTASELQRKQASETIKANEQKLLEAQEIAQMGHYAYDIPSDTWSSSEVLANIFSIDDNYKRDISGWLQLVHPDHQEMMLNYFKKDVLTQHKPFDKKYKIINLKNGDERWVHGLGYLKFDDNGNPFEMFGTIQDITAKKQADEMVNKLSQAIEQAGEAILITDKEGVIEYLNPAYINLTGYEAKETVGGICRLFKGEGLTKGAFQSLKKAIAKESDWQEKVIDRKKDGSSYPEILSIYPIFSQTGESHLTHFVVICSDLSKLEEMEKQFYQAQKMEAIGTLIGGIAHDFNNMLSAIIGNLFLVKKKLHGQPEALLKVARIEEISFSAADMIAQLLTFARKGQVNMRTLELTSVIKDAFKFIHTLIPANIVVHKEVCDDILQINGDATQLHQIIMNLVNNAKDAIVETEAPFIAIKLEAFQPDEFIGSDSDFETGPYAHLSVEDNGCGIPEHQIERLFEPFFTTKEQGKGTGLGLAMVFGSIKTHQGFIEVESSEGKGTIFHIYIPLLLGHDINPTPVQEETCSTGQGELILIADDDTNIRETTAEVLQGLNYRVLLAEDGEEALKIFNEHQDEIDLMLLDVVMPHCGGVELADHIRDIKPNMPFIFVTGYDKERLTQNHQYIQSNDIISKPVKIELLNSIIHEKLKKKIQQQTES